MELIEIAGRRVGPGHRAYVIAEIGSNHNGDMGLARELVDAAAECGADAVKFQSWSVDSLISQQEYARHPRYEDKKRHFGSLKEMVERFQLTVDQHHEMAGYCRRRGITFLSTAFSCAEIDLLDQLGVPAFKVASMDINHPLLLSHFASKGKPIIMSTGMATMAEIEAAIAAVRQGGAAPLALLHCVALYPPADSDLHLRNIATLSRAFALPVGFSDHSQGTVAAIAAMALGACIIEKHFTLDKDLEGWDHWISADPPEMKAIVEGCRRVHAALGSRVRTVSEAELEKRSHFRRRIVVKRELPAGSVLTLEDLEFKRPGTGIHPNETRYVVGRRLNRRLLADEELAWADLE